ncbi:hypothetical protein N7468_001603 [Penicillium chermesinum]|uniref:Uncharacterized protein n=1 Tax=Penicillium chermesinum TaxID=63820 RepID=A0A9W9PGY4_9EURO|nr:uncharacterized protein N7468_001603 [Penicillium chermesinum]KAJ5246620.1 hypothetical protein N7468_001603 [Penicillium chermesinum]
MCNTAGSALPAGGAGLYSVWLGRDPAKDPAKDPIEEAGIKGSPREPGIPIGLCKDANNLKKMVVITSLWLVREHSWQSVERGIRGSADPVGAMFERV